MVNRRGGAKTSILPAADRPASWTSRFGSVTFNQYGREFPTGGMNEAGLVVELMWLDDTRYPRPDDRPAVGALEWIQYQLDRWERAADVVRAAREVRVSSTVPLHYLVCDRTAACATVEFLAGELVAHTGTALPVPVLTNDRYDASLRFLEQKGDGGSSVAGPGSLERFARTAGLVRLRAARPGKASLVDNAFDILDRAAQGPHTRWSIVYDLRRGRIYYRTRDNRSLRWVDLAAFDFSCATPVRVLDINAGAGQVAARFADFRLDLNRDLIARSIRATAFAAGTSPEEIAAMAKHPAAMACQP